MENLEEIGSVRFQLSLGFMLRLTTAAAIVVVANQHLAAGFGYPASFLVLAVFYAVKSAISIACVGRALTSMLLFIPSFILTLSFFCYSESKHSSLELTDILVLLPLVYLTIPTVSFLFDLLRGKRRSVDFMLIRSLLELSLLVPLWMLSLIHI